MIFIAESWRSSRKTPFIQQYTALDTLSNILSSSVDETFLNFPQWDSLRLLEHNFLYQKQVRSFVLQLVKGLPIFLLKVGPVSRITSQICNIFVWRAPQWMSLPDKFVQNLKVTEINELENSTITNLLFVISLHNKSLMIFTVITTCWPCTFGGFVIGLLAHGGRWIGFCISCFNIHVGSST